MLPGPFSFAGRLARWPYVKGCLVLGMAGAIPVVLALGAYPAIRQGDNAALVVLVGLLALFGIVVVWISLTLQVRRCRDIGWDPWFVIPPWFALQIADPVLAIHVPSLALGRHDATVIGASVNLVLVLSLLFWPSADGDVATTAPIRERRVAPSPPAAPALASLPRAAVSAPRTSFGRR